MPLKRLDDGAAHLTYGYSQRTAHAREALHGLVDLSKGSGDARLPIPLSGGYFRPVVPQMLYLGLSVAQPVLKMLNVAKRLFQQGACG